MSYDIEKIGIDNGFTGNDYHSLDNQIRSSNHSSGMKNNILSMLAISILIVPTLSMNGCAKKGIQNKIYNAPIYNTPKTTTNSYEDIDPNKLIPYLMHGIDRDGDLYGYIEKNKTLVPKDESSRINGSPFDFLFFIWGMEELYDYLDENFEKKPE